MKRTVDATGLACPLPVVETKKALREMSGGELEVIVDNIVSLQNLEKMAKQMGLAYRLETVSDAKHIIHITADESSGEEGTSRKQADARRSGDAVVVLSSDRMGRGDEELGRVLMKSFVYALTEMDPCPPKSCFTMPESSCLLRVPTPCLICRSLRRRV